MKINESVYRHVDQGVTEMILKPGAPRNASQPVTTMLTTDPSPLSTSSPQNSTFLLLLPIETLERILSELASPRDLLHLALTCKKLAALIIPFHIFYRVFKCDIGDIHANMWQYLIEVPHLTRRFHTLICVEKYEETWDETCDEACDETCEDYDLPPFPDDWYSNITPAATPLEVISRMQSLVKVTTELYQISMFQLLQILAASCPLLQEASLSTTYVPHPATMPYVPAGLSFPSLKSLRLNCKDYGTDSLPSFQLLRLALLPKLTSLELDTNITLRDGDSVSTLFTNVTYPSLCELTILCEGKFFDPMMVEGACIDIMQEFFSRNYTIERIYIYCQTGYIWECTYLDHENCPNLQVLGVRHDRESGVCLSDVLCTTLAPQLTKVSALLCNFCIDLFLSMEFLQECDVKLPQELIPRFLANLSVSIKRLHTTLSDGPFKGKDTYIAAISRMGNLTHVGGFGWGALNLIGEGDQDIFSALSVLPHLKYIGIQDPTVWIPRGRLPLSKFDVEEGWGNLRSHWRGTIDTIDVFDWVQYQLRW
ncbi:hypothetical protein M422DRAFT_254144 [Sphaerobolus stellatus SS14]|uniref:F-box domain-containing protein n=1 Tax=Sphaerobolus stellatus (strain SS14) TaxID=990650 RepID=A0A0C9VLQ6_SPHS4|nr:hypothetical protein M422DRAFT_254144 [Sphaerobolus stellatus SS14]